MGDLPEEGGHCSNCGNEAGILTAIRIARGTTSGAYSLDPATSKPLLLNAGGLVAAGLATRPEVDRNWGVLQFFSQRGWCIQLTPGAAGAVHVDGVAVAGTALIPLRTGTRLVLKGTTSIKLSVEAQGR